MNKIKNTHNQYSMNTANSLKKQIKERIVQLQQTIKTKEAALQNVPEGTINVSSSPKNGFQYYYKKKTSDKKKIYLQKKNLPLIQQLCQKEYDLHVLLTAQKELQELENLDKYYAKPINEEIYHSLPIGKQKMIHPVILSDEDFVKEWQNAEYKKQTFRDGIPEYYTDKGERVRSKSEILIANALNKYGIPYRYECPLLLNGYGWIYPDFTVLNIRLRQVYYWEHMGKMDDPEYMESALQKIRTYEKNNLFPGESLILTYETTKHPLNSKDIDCLIKRYFL